MKILLIEDIRTERKIFKHWLEEAGCDVIEASDGNEGIALYRDNHPDLVITDIVMPEKEGIEMMIDLRKDFPDAKIFAISGAGKKPGEFLGLAKHLGAMRTFVKPIDKRELLDAVREFFPKPV
jgi:CheY-like chemotaxis protein